ncbi:MAG: hypothetical protein R3343_09510 [Nitriliruptorales bacterium]|nr:hypothetical protein [Nitriliruptorales bacterium]
MDDDDPTLLRREPLTADERRRAALVGLTPIGIALLVLLPVALLGSASVVEAVVAAAVYGGLLGLAAGFVYVDRVQARQCPRCRRRRVRGEQTCDRCGYDLEGEPRFACPERHDVYVEPGLCHCGRRLVALDPPRGIGGEITAMLKVGAWLLAFLVGVGLILQFVN